MKNKLVIRSVMLLLWLIVIFTFSEQDGKVSSNQSSEVIYKVVDVVASDISHDEKVEKVEEYSFIVRKTAHFLEYFILGMLVFNVLVLLVSKNIIIFSILMSLFFAMSDEVHQLYVPGRDGNVRDVLIDVSGASLGVFTYGLINSKRKV